MGVGEEGEGVKKKFSADAAKMIASRTGGEKKKTSMDVFYIFISVHIYGESSFLSLFDSRFMISVFIRT